MSSEVGCNQCHHPVFSCSVCQISKEFGLCREKGFVALALQSQGTQVEMSILGIRHSIQLLATMPKC